MIKATWSPQFCLMERRVNQNYVHDSNVDFYDRIVTYEGLDYNCQVEGISAPQLIAEIQKICLSIADHIKAVTGGNVSITRMTLFFKQDENEKLWFQFCSSLKIFDLSLEEKEHLSYKPKELELAVPSNAKTKYFPKYGKYFEMTYNRNLCVGCNTLIRKELLYSISLRMVLSCYDHEDPEPKHLSTQTDTKQLNLSIDEMDYAIPTILKRMSPNLTYHKYLELKQDPYWGHQDLQVCDNCYLHYTSFFIDPPNKKVPTSPSRMPTHYPQSQFPSAMISPKDTLRSSKFILKKRKSPQTAIQSTRSNPILTLKHSKLPTRCTTTSSTPKGFISPSALSTTRAMSIYRSHEKLPRLSRCISLAGSVVPSTRSETRCLGTRINGIASQTKTEFLLETISSIKSRLLDLENF